MITIRKFKEYIYERWDIALAPFLHLELDEEDGEIWVEEEND